MVALFEVDEPHALGVPSDLRYVRGIEPDDHTFFGNEHHPAVGAQELHPDHGAVAAAGLDVDDALAAAGLQAVLVERRALAVTVGAYGEHAAPRRDDLEGDDLVLGLEGDALYPVSRASHGTDVVLLEADRHAFPGREQHLVGA